MTAEYNHGIPVALKNAIDFLYREWNNKATGFVSYGGTDGVRSVEHLRLVYYSLFYRYDTSGSRGIFNRIAEVNIRNSLTSILILKKR